MTAAPVPAYPPPPVDPTYPPPPVDPTYPPPADAVPPGYDAPMPSYPPPPVDPAYRPSPGGYAPGGFAGKPGTNQKAVIALICGVAGLILCGVILGPAAIILGRQAQNEIAASGGQQSGAGLARAAFIIGIVAVVGWAIGLFVRTTG